MRHGADPGTAAAGYLLIPRIRAVSQGLVLGTKHYGNGLVISQ